MVCSPSLCGGRRHEAISGKTDFIWEFLRLSGQIFSCEKKANPPPIVPLSPAGELPKNQREVYSYIFLRFLQIGPNPDLAHMRTWSYESRVKVLANESSFGFSPSDNLLQFLVGVVLCQPEVRQGSATENHGSSTTLTSPGVVWFPPPRDFVSWASV